VIVCYDGSAAAVDALEYTASVLPAAPVIVVTVWREIIEEMASSGTAPPAGDPVAANTQARRTAEEMAREGAERAEAAGVRAEPLVVETTGPVWRAIEVVAEQHDALLIACGTSRAGLKTVLPGDVANALVQHAGRPVLVVPTGKAAAERRHQLDKR
jgi:nucleotide-binding universal stress UspA family protein